MIFVSHNHKDKVVVEQIALRLRDTFGQDNVFYDSWSVQPGDGIIDKMNEGLANCEIFLFFVSKNSLQSNLVKLEWQNAVMKATHGKTKIIPTKLDDCLMPPILLQSLYVDLFGQGLEVALRQIVDIASGKNTFSPGPQQFSNIRAYTYMQDKSRIVEIHAEHYMEPVSSFRFLVENAKNELDFQYKSGSFHVNNFHEGLKLSNGNVCNAGFMRVERGTVPGFPFVAEIIPKDAVQIKFLGILHEKKSGIFEPIPVSEGKRHA